jgi:hypothetical protein
MMIMFARSDDSPLDLQPRELNMDLAGIEADYSSGCEDI